MLRLKKYDYVIKSSLASKAVVLSAPITCLRVKLVAGLYKPASIKLEHGLVLAALSNAMPVAGYQLHGKRRKRTVSLTNNFKFAGQVLDKIIHELLPRVGDFRTPKVRRPLNNNYVMRIRQKFTPLEDFEDLISSEMFDQHRGIFLPLNIHLSFLSTMPTRAQIGPHYLRMLRLPLNFYQRHKAPAFDDLATFGQLY